MFLTVEKLHRWDPSLAHLVRESRLLPGIPDTEARRFHTWVDWMADRIRHQEVSALAAWVDGKPMGLAGYHWHGDIVRVHYLYAARDAGPAGLREFLAGAEARWSSARRIVVEGGPQTFLDEVLGARGFLDAGFQRFERARYERPLVEVPGGPPYLRFDPLPLDNEAGLARLQAEGYSGGPDFLLIDEPLKMVQELLGDPWFVPELSYSVSAGGELQAALYTLRKGRVAWIASVCVHPSARGKGLAGRLLRGALAAYRDAGYERAGLNVTLGNKAAVRLYEGIGFTRFARLSLVYVKEIMKPISGNENKH